MDSSKKILITGASGLLGHYLSNFFQTSRYQIFALKGKHSVNVSGVKEIEIDLLDFYKVTDLLKKIHPDYIIHCAGLTNVDQCERNVVLAEKIHIDLSFLVAKVAGQINSKIIHISTDHLWDGSVPMVIEDTPVCPLNVYGRTKAEAEKAVISVNSKALILRTNFFGPGLEWRQSLSDWIITSLNRNEKIKAFSDVFFTPISMFHLSNLMLRLITEEAKGIYHVVGSERISKYDFAVSISKILNKPADLIQAISIKDIQLFAPRPLDMSLSTKKVSKFLNEEMPTIQSGVNFLKE